MPEEKTHAAPLPEELQEQLDSFRSELWKIKITEALIAGVLGLLLSFLLVFLLDRLWPTPGLLRLLILIAGASLFALFAPWWINKWVLRHRREEQIAHLIARKYPRLGDRLLGVVELQDQDEAGEILSPELRRAAMREVTRQARKRDLVHALPANRKRSGFLFVALLAAAALLALLIVPPAALSSLKRWLLPLSDTPRYTFTQLDPPPKKITVPYGEPFDLTLRLSGKTEREPETGRARYARQEWITNPLDPETKTYRFPFPPQQKEDHITVEIGDASHKILSTPALRPALETVTARITLPAYLQRPPQNANLRSGSLPLLQGTTFTLHAKATRDLARATLASRPLPGEKTTPGESPKAAPLSHLLSHPLTTSGPRLASLAIKAPAAPSAYTLDWTDTLGLRAEVPFQFRTTPFQDEAPSAYLQNIVREVILLEEDTIEFEALAEDDFGLKATGLEWRGKFTKPRSDDPANGEMPLGQGAPDATRLHSPVSFSPAALGIKPQRLVLRAYAQDYLPGRPRAYSQPVVIHILTRDEHAHLLQTRYENLIGRLEDAARREQVNLDENQRLEKQDAQKLREKNSLDKLQQQTQAEQENTEKVGNLAKEMEEFFKQAVKNGEIPNEQLQKLEDTRRRLDELAGQDLPKVQKNLQKAQDQNQSPQQNKQDLQKAIEEQKKAVEKMQEAVQKARQANENLEAATFVNRLRRAAREETGIGSTLDSALPFLIGRSPDRLDPADQRLLREQAAQQKNTAADVRWIQEDLHHFSSRTRKPLFQQIARELAQLRVDAFMEDNRRRLDSLNHSSTAADVAHHLAALLNDLAKKLDDQKQGGGSGGGNGGSSNQPPSEKNFDDMLRLMRLIQAEQGLRARTRALEQLRRSHQPKPTNN